MKKYAFDKKIILSLQTKNGGILATPLKGAYPYVYTRDAVIITKAMNKLGLTKNAEKFYYFMKKYTKLNIYQEVFQRYTASGYPSVTRREENDNEGLLLHGIYDTYKHNKQETFLENMWQLIMETADLLTKYEKDGLIRTKRSVHEFDKLETGFEIWANAAAVRGLLDAAAMAKVLNHDEEKKRWETLAKRIQKTMKQKLFNKKENRYIKNKKFPNTPDISILAPFYFDIENSKSILRSSLKHIKKHLWNSDLGGYRRFRKFEIVDDWHWYTGGSGSWLTLTCWVANHYKKLGDTKHYREAKHWVEKIRTMTKGLLPEHIATIEEYEEWKRYEIEFNTRIINETKVAEKNTAKIKDKHIVLWANPLGWSHAEYILMD